MRGPLEFAVRYVKTGRLDDINGKAKAGGKTQDGTGVAGNVRLIEGYVRCLAMATVVFFGFSSKRHS